MNRKVSSVGPSRLRETGVALAVLAIYVLTLLLPLHQAAGLQRNLDALGYSTLGNWSICQSGIDGSGKQQPDPLVCPALGIAKYDLAVILPPALIVALAPSPTTTRLVEISGTSSPRLPDHVGQSRAPPTTV